MQKRVGEARLLNGSVDRFETDSHELAVRGLGQRLSSPGSLTHIVIHHQNEVHSCCSVLPCTVQAGSSSDSAEATPLPNQRSSFKLFPDLTRLFSLNAFAALLCLSLSFAPSLSPSPLKTSFLLLLLLLLSLLLWCLVSCKRHKRQCSLFLPPF